MKTASTSAYSCLLDSDQHHAEMFICIFVSGISEGEHIIFSWKPVLNWLWMTYGTILVSTLWYIDKKNLFHILNLCMSSFPPSPPSPQHYSQILINTQCATGSNSFAMSTKNYLNLYPPASKPRSRNLMSLKTHISKPLGSCKAPLL